MRRALAATAAALLLLVATGCSREDDSEGRGDAPVAVNTSTGKKGGDDGPATCTNMPDGYGNVCTKCVAGAKPWRTIEGTSTSYNGSQFVVVQDPEACGGKFLPYPLVVSSGGGIGAEEPDDGS